MLVREVMRKPVDVLQSGTARPKQGPFEREQRIRERAHALWEREGRPEGRDGEHWAQACREIDMGEHAAESGTAGSYENVTPGEAAAKNGIRLQTWAVIGAVALLLMANVVKRRAV
jgi:Protein of unknown function (DUF2934)